MTQRKANMVAKIGATVVVGGGFLAVAAFMGVSPMGIGVVLAGIVYGVWSSK